MRQVLTFLLSNQETETPRNGGSQITQPSRWQRRALNLVPIGANTRFNHCTVLTAQAACPGPCGEDSCKKYLQYLLV